MDNVEKSKELINRYDKLLDGYIKKFSIGIEYNDQDSFYSDFMMNFVFGRLDDYFSSPALKKVGNDGRRGLHDLVHKYSSLCFYQGDYRNWSESIEGTTSRDLEFISMKIFDNFNFLYEVASLGGEKVLKEIQKLNKGDMSNQGSIVDHLRNSFDGEDEALKYTLLEMSKEIGFYKDFSDDEKRILLENPKGTLFVEENQVVSPASVVYLNYELASRGYEDNHDIPLFEEIVQDISYEYVSKNNSKKE